MKNFQKLKIVNLVIFVFFNFCSNETTTLESVIPSTTESVIPSTTENLNLIENFVSPENVNISEKLFFNDFSSDCTPYLGSINLTSIECLVDSTILYEIPFDEPLVNLTKFSGRYFVSTKVGKIYEFLPKDNSFVLILNISEKVDSTIDRGLKGFSISNDSDTFVVSYVNYNQELTVDLYSFSNSLKNNTFIKNILNLKKYSSNESISWHYGGHIIWSELFNEFIIGIGDFNPTGQETRINPLPLDTNELFGKLVILNTDYEVEYSYYVSKSNISTSNFPLIGIGLRNPWQFFEYGQTMFIPDVGYSVNEEISLSNFDLLPVNFGWPIYEGLETSIEIDNIKDYKMDLNVYIDNKKEDNILDFTTKYSQKPFFTYNHNPTEDKAGYRGAIIGGDIFTKSSQKYQDNLIFADHVSGELFLYDFVNNKLLITPSFTIKGGVTAIKVFDSIPNSLIATTYNEGLKIITLSD